MTPSGEERDKTVAATGPEQLLIKRAGREAWLQIPELSVPDPYCLKAPFQLPSTHH